MQTPKCLWFTGLSGSGKSTIASLVEKKLHAPLPAGYDKGARWAPKPCLRNPDRACPISLSRSGSGRGQGKRFRSSVRCLARQPMAPRQTRTGQIGRKTQDPPEAGFCPECGYSSDGCALFPSHQSGGQAGWQCHADHHPKRSVVTRHAPLSPATAPEERGL